MKRLVMTTAIAFMVAAPAHADVAVSITGGEGGTRTTDSAHGWEFTVNTNIVLTHLGLYDQELDGFVHDHPIGLFRVSDGALLTSGTMSAGAGDPLIANFRYIDVADVALSTTENYVLSYYSADEFGDFVVTDGEGEVFAPEVDWVAGRWGSGAGGLIIPPNSVDVDRYGPNFQFVTPPPRELIWFNNQGEFEAFVASQGKVLKGIEDYEESILGPNAADPFDDSLESGVPNLPDGFPFPVGMTGLPNLRVQSNFEHDLFNPNNPRGADALAAFSATAGNFVSDVVIANFFVDSLDLIFTSEKTAVGFNTLRFTSPGAMEVNVFSTTNELLGEMASNSDPAGTNFIGVWSSVPIGRINLFDVSNGAEGADRIQAWEVGEDSCPADFDLSGSVDVKDLLFLLGAWGPCPKKGDCLADLVVDGAVDVKDLLFLLGAWGPCP